MENNIICGDALEELKGIEDNSIDLVLCDPPYHLSKMASDWSPDEVASQQNMQVVTSLPSGMVFSKSQGKEFYEWYFQISKEVLRVLKPGAFFFSFSAPRLYHRMASASDDAGFEIRDLFVWLYTQNQAKAMSLNHVIDRLKISEEEKAGLKSHLAGWKTPQVKSCHEPIMMAQKPVEGKFLGNYLTYGVGLVNTNLKIGDNMFPSNVASTEEFDTIIDRYFLVSKPNKQEKGDYNSHKTVKSVNLCKYLICLTTRENAIVLDPFCGSGTTLVAAKETNRKFIGIDKNKEYLEITKRRLDG